MIHARKNLIVLGGTQALIGQSMRVSPELTEIIRSVSGLPSTTLDEQLAAIQEQRAQEVEHFLRACALRLKLAPATARPH